jgi:hypothetical protein
VDEAGEDSPVAVVVGRDVADGDVRGERGAIDANGPYTGTLHSGDGETVDDNVRRILEVDTMLRPRQIRQVDENSRLGEERDWRRRGAIGGEIETAIRARAHGNAVACADLIGRALKR